MPIQDEQAKKLLQVTKGFEEQEGAYFRGECVSCGLRVMSLVQLEDGSWEPCCPNCEPTPFWKALNARLVNGAGSGDGEKVPRLAPKFLTFQQLLTQPSPVWMVEGLIFEQSLIEIFGAANHGKTFLSSDLAFAIRRGGKWCGRKINKPGAVVYVNADGGLGFADRARAWQQMHEHEDAEHEFYTYPEPISLHRAAEMHEFHAALKWLPEQPVFVVFDTYSQCIPGMNENQQEFASLVVQQLNRIRREIGATVCLLHHTNKAGETERGSNVILGACDTQMFVQKPEEGRLRMSCTKQRDAAYFEPMHFDLVRVPGTDFVWPQLNTERADTPHEIKEGNLVLMEAVLAEYPGATAKFLMRETSLPKSTIYDHIRELKMAQPPRIFEGPPVDYGEEAWTTRKPVGYYNVPPTHRSFSE